MFEVQIETNPALLLKVTLISSFSIFVPVCYRSGLLSRQRSHCFSFISVNLPDGEIPMLHISPGWGESTVVEPHVYFRYCTIYNDAKK